MFTLICWYKKGRLTVSKREVYEQKTEELLLPIVESNGFQLVDVQYVKEGGNWYLRAYIDKPGGISVDDCEVVSRAFSDILECHFDYFALRNRNLFYNPIEVYPDQEIW